MKCPDFEANVTDLLKGELEESKRAETLAHALACKECGALLEAERRLTADLQALAAEQGALQAPPRIEKLMVTAFRARSARQGALLPTRNRWLWGTAAAGVVLALAIAGLLHRHAVNPTEAGKQPQSTTPINTQHNTRVPENPPLADLQPAKAQPERVPVGRARPRPAEARRPNLPEAVEVEVTTGFYTIPYVEPVRPEESIRVVRTRVPRYWLTAAGLQVNDERAFDPIQADVLVGEDNVARAVRFVQQWQLQPGASRLLRPVPVKAQYVP